MFWPVNRLFHLMSLFKHLGSGPTQQIATVEHADIRGSGTTRLHCVAKLAFL